MNNERKPASKTISAFGTLIKIKCLGTFLTAEINRTKTIKNHRGPHFKNLRYAVDTTGARWPFEMGIVCAFLTIKIWLFTHLVAFRYTAKTIYDKNHRTQFNCNNNVIIDDKI